MKYEEEAKIILREIGEAAAVSVSRDERCIAASWWKESVHQINYYAWFKIFRLRDEPGHKQGHGENGQTIEEAFDKAIAKIRELKAAHPAVSAVEVLEQTPAEMGGAL